MKSAQELALLANQVRQDVITMIGTAGSGHPAGSLGVADVLVFLYNHFLFHRPAQPNWLDRDRLILSAGHLCPALYATLAHNGYFDSQELLSLRQIDSKLQGHPLVGELPGVENTSGPLGQGVSVATGLALAAKRDQKNWRVVCLMSDGEQQEGQVWEAYLLAAKYQLDNLLFVLDANNIQINGLVSEILPLAPLRQKYESFGLWVEEVDGHDFLALDEAVKLFEHGSGQPKLLIAHTLAGKGVSFMEGQHAWHGRAPNQGELKQALAELQNQEQELKQLL